MGETKFALYLGAIFSTLLRVFTFLFLRVVYLFLTSFSLGCIFSDWLFQVPFRKFTYLLPSLYCTYIATVPFAPRFSDESADPSSSSSSDKKDQSTSQSESTTPNEACPLRTRPLRHAILTPRPLQANSNKDVVWELLFSLPTTHLTSIFTATINTLLLLLAVDFVYSPVIHSATDVTFTRLGAVYPDAAKITVRYPLSGTNATEHNVVILWRPATPAAAEPWSDGPTLHLQPDFDWTNTTKLTKLWPSTEYECTYTNCPIIICSKCALTPCLFRRLGTYEQNSPSLPGLPHSLPYLPGFTPPNGFPLPFRRVVVSHTQLSLLALPQQKDQGL